MDLPFILLIYGNVCVCVCVCVCARACMCAVMLEWLERVSSRHSLPNRKPLGFLFFCFLGVGLIGDEWNHQPCHESTDQPILLFMLLFNFFKYYFCEWKGRYTWRWLATAKYNLVERLLESKVNRKQKILSLFCSMSIMGNEVHQDPTVNSAHLPSKLFSALINNLLVIHISARLAVMRYYNFITFPSN